jgi:hypothetical protein
MSRPKYAAVVNVFADPEGARETLRGLGCVRVSAEFESAVEDGSEEETKLTEKKKKPERPALPVQGKSPIDDLKQAKKHSSKWVRIKRGATPLSSKKKGPPLPFCLRPYKVNK